MKKTVSGVEEVNLVAVNDGPLGPQSSGQVASHRRTTDLREDEPKEVFHSKIGVLIETRSPVAS
jgi:hypothetical protein